jgi:choline-sulfatase
MYGEPGSPQFKIMIRQDAWKYIFMANGGREQLFDVAADPAELHNCMSHEDQIGRRLRELAVRACRVPGAAAGLAGDDLRAFPFRPRPLRRIYQFDRSRGVPGFPARPEDVLTV